MSSDVPGVEAPELSPSRDRADVGMVMVRFTVRATKSGSSVVGADVAKEGTVIL